MSRGGRGGGRGGRGGGRGGRPNVPWDTGDEPDARPSELFPPYTIPLPGSLKETEKAAVSHFLLLRRQLHASPLYTSKRTLQSDLLAPRKMYGQAQTNSLYGVRNKATQDPFTAVQTYSQRFVREERALPDWSSRPVCRELFPRELLEAVEPEAMRGKKRKLELSRVSALPNAEDVFGMNEGHEGGNLLERLEAMGNEEGEEGVELADDEEGAQEEEEQDEVYDDSDAGDYDAENYFDNGDEMGEDFGGDGDDGEGTF